MVQQLRKSITALAFFGFAAVASCTPNRSQTDDGDDGGGGIIVPYGDGGGASHPCRFASVKSASASIQRPLSFRQGRTL